VARGLPDDGILAKVFRKESFSIDGGVVFDPGDCVEDVSEIARVPAHHCAALRRT
jgi:hypothetical protein